VTTGNISVTPITAALALSAPQTTAAANATVSLTVAQFALTAPQATVLVHTGPTLTSAALTLTAPQATAAGVQDATANLTTVVLSLTAPQATAAGTIGRPTVITSRETTTIISDEPSASVTGTRRRATITSQES
jgi:hypothetical protein